MVSKPASGSNDSEALFEAIAGDLSATGYSVLPNALPLPLLEKLSSHVLTMSAADFKKAGIGRDSEHQLIR